MEKSEYEVMFRMENDFWWYRGLHSLVEYFVKQKYEKKTQWLEIFDAGCGTGRMLELLRQYGSVSGVDISGDAVMFCRERGVSDVSQCDLNQWHSNGRKYDIVYSLDVLYHKGVAENIASILQRFREALAQDGLLILNLPAFPLLYRNHDKVVHTAKRFTKRDVANCLSNAGFKIRVLSYRLPPLFIVILLQKIMCCFCKPSETSSDLQKISPVLNLILYLYNRVENIFLRCGYSFSFGSSVFVVAEKK